MHAPVGPTDEPADRRPTRATTDVDQIVRDLDLEAVVWMRDAACRGADPEVFFDEGDWRFWYPSQVALALCRSCPVRVTCLDFALTHRMVGTWGGTSDYQRRSLLRGIPRRRCPVCEGRALAVITSSWGHPTLIICVACGMSWDGPPASRPDRVELPDSVASA
jgi:WhiB family redox-sensing transcriptional regulator